MIAIDDSADALKTVKEVTSRNWSESAEFRLSAVDDLFSSPSVGYLTWNLEADNPEDSEESRRSIAEVIGTRGRSRRKRNILSKWCENPAVNNPAISSKIFRRKK